MLAGFRYPSLIRALTNSKFKQYQMQPSCLFRFSPSLCLCLVTSIMPDNIENVRSQFYCNNIPLLLQAWRRYDSDRSGYIESNELKVKYIHQTLQILIKPCRIIWAKCQQHSCSDSSAARSQRLCHSEKHAQCSKEY